MLSCGILSLQNIVLIRLIAFIFYVTPQVPLARAIKPPQTSEGIWRRQVKGPPPPNATSPAEPLPDPEEVVLYMGIVDFLQVSVLRAWGSSSPAVRGTRQSQRS